MLKIEHTEVVGWRAAIRGMRNPMNSLGRRAIVRLAQIAMGACQAKNVSGTRMEPLQAQTILTS